MSFYQQVETYIAQALQADRARLRNMLRSVRQAEEAGRVIDEPLEKLQRELEASLAAVEARTRLVPALEYDAALPVVARKDDIAAAIRAHPVVVVCGETGSGKSTQLPKICLEVGRGVTGLIGHTQPRRIAARSIAARLAEELQTTVGGKVGFKIRFADQTSPETLIKVMTDGVLLAESQHDRAFDAYDTLIIDEAHERSLNIDFLLGYLKRLLARRDNLKLIITSATIDAERFAAHFGDGPTPAPIIEVSGRTYPVEVLYRPLESEAGEEDDLDLAQGVLRAVDELCRRGPGDLLVFLPTEREILDVSHKLRSRVSAGTEILPLYARLSTQEQNRVFRPHSGRRIVLATNVAESSLTVPGIHYVVDTGTARISRYSARSKLQRLPIEPIAQASADQRKGRCGRIGPGVCIRLYREDDFLRRDRFTAPEILRTNLAAVLLQTLALGLGPLDEFPFLDPPKPEAIRDGYKTLHELGALDDARQLTPIGRQMARLPADPRIARMLLAADREGCLADVLVIAAALETQDPRERPPDRQSDADAAHARYQWGESDFIALLRLWDFYHHLKADLSKSQFKKACKQNYLSEVRLREWSDVHRQLLDMAAQSGLAAGRRRWTTAADAQARADTARENAAQENSSGPAPPARTSSQAQNTAAREDRQSLRELGGGAYGAIHRAILAGLLTNVAVRGETAEYHACGGNKVFLWPGSCVFASKPKWIVAAELVETTRRYARTAARIDPDWIEPLATHLVTRHYSDPQWDRRGGGAIAQERVTLSGLTIVPRRRVRYGPIDPAASRELFIRCGLVEGDLDLRAPFFRHNQELRASLTELAARTRQRDYLVEDQLVYDFYDARLPRDVYDLHRLEKWRPTAEQQTPRRLFLTPADLLGAERETPPADEYPAALPIDRMQLPLSYHFEPGAERDGITLSVPREALFQLSAERLGWLIPGYLAEKIEHLIRALPKQLRRNLIPAPEVARKVARQLHFAKASFLPAVAAALSAEAGERIGPDQFDLEKLPAHLVMNVRVLDDQGAVVAEGRNLDVLREKVGGERPAEIVAPGKSPWRRDGVKAWDWDDLPEQVDLDRGGLVLTRFPAIVDSGATVSLRLCDTLAEAETATWLGLRRLLVLDRPRELREQVEWLPGLARMQPLAAPLCREQTLTQQLIDSLAQRMLDAAISVWSNRLATVTPGALPPLPPPPRTKARYQALLKAAREQLLPAVQLLTKLAGPLLEGYHQVRLALEQVRPPHWKYALDDLREQFTGLFPPHFLANVPGVWLVHYPRYLKGITARLNKLASGLPRDKQQFALLEPHLRRYHTRREQHQKTNLHDPELEFYRWMLEEYRISLFAQELGAQIPISPQRLDKQWALVAG